MDLQGRRSGFRGGVVSLPSDTLKTAQEAAGEGLPQFVTRAIESRAKLDKRKKRE